MKLDGEPHYLRPTVDHEGEGLEVFAAKHLDRAALKVIGNAADQVCRRWLNNRAENSHQPFRRREGAMGKSRDIKTRRKFAVIHAAIHNHFNLDRHLDRRDIFKQNRAAALAEWHQLAA